MDTNNQVKTSVNVYIFIIIMNFIPCYFQVLLSCAPVWEHPEVSDDMKKDTSSLQRMADSIPWRDHWMQAIYYLPEEVSITCGVDVNLIGYHDEYSFWFKLLNGPM